MTLKNRSKLLLKILFRSMLVASVLLLPLGAVAIYRAYIEAVRDYYASMAVAHPRQFFGSFQAGQQRKGVSTNFSPFEITFKV